MRETSEHDIDITPLDPGRSNPLLIYKDRDRTNRIIIHDSHTPPDVAQVTEISRWNLTASENALYMGLLSVGYHFIIERDGEVVNGRPHKQVGSHTPGHNMDSVSICLVGGRDLEGNGEDNFTSLQRKATIKLCAWLRRRYGDHVEVLGHTEVQKYRNKSLPPCPMLDMELLRDDIKLYEMGIIL